jgi:iron complex transport system substrate-binding protein
MKRQEFGGVSLSVILAVIVLIGAAFAGGYFLSQQLQLLQQPKPSPTVVKEMVTEKESVIVDDFGRRVTVPREPQRIVSLAPSTTEILFAIGAGDKLVGRTDSCNYPDEVKNIPSVGGFFYGISVETIMGLEPDLVFAYLGQEAVVAKLEEMGYPVIVRNPESIEAVLKDIRLVGYIMNKTAEAEQVVAEMEAVMNAVDANISKLNMSAFPRVYLELWGEEDSFMSACQGTFDNDLIFRAGGKNIAANAYSPYGYPTLDEEFILAQDPEVIITTDMNTATVDDIKNREGWEDVSAIKNDRVYFILGDLLNRPGPRIVEGLQILAELLHPELFQ